MISNLDRQGMKKIVFDQFMPTQCQSEPWTPLSPVRNVCLLCFRPRWPLQGLCFKRRKAKTIVCLAWRNRATLLTTDRLQAVDVALVRVSCERLSNSSCRKIDWWSLSPLYPLKKRCVESCSYVCGCDFIVGRCTKHRDLQYCVLDWLRLVSVWDFSWLGHLLLIASLRAIAILVIILMLRKGRKSSERVCLSFTAVTEGGTSDRSWTKYILSTKRVSSLLCNTAVKLTIQYQAHWDKSSLCIGYSMDLLVG